MDSKSISIHNTKEFSKLLCGIEVSPFMKLKQNLPILPGEIENVKLNELNISDTLYCSFCNTGFSNQTQQRQHYKLDWHRYNLKQHMAQRKTVSEEKFAQLADEVSSISGSDSESDVEETNPEGEKEREDARLNNLIARRSRILFNNSLGQVISLHRSLFINKKEEVSDQMLIEIAQKLPIKTRWLIVMLGGGHFAAAIFKDGVAVVHKTFHSYTVRAKQGGTQSSKDGKGSHSKSAGASLRRYNEQTLTQHIQDIMKSWGPDLVKCDLMYYRAVGRANSSILFGGSNPPLLRTDPRLRAIPVTTHRPTFNELKRIYALLTTVFIYDSSEMFRVNFSVTKTDKLKDNSNTDEKEETEKEKSPKKVIDRAKERPLPERELPMVVQKLAEPSSSSEGDGMQQKERVTSPSDVVSLEFGLENISFTEALQEFDDSVSAVIKRQKTKKKKKKEINNETDNLTQEQVDLWKGVHSACEAGDLDKLKESLENCPESLTVDQKAEILNQKNIEGQTVLHKMASQAKPDVVRLLLLHGCCPCVKDKKAQTPYDLCPDKNTRNTFRRFMGEFPDMYDFSKSHIPSALTDSIEAEIAEKKRAARKVKRQKDKERKQVVELKKQEEDEKARFLKLSDQEKRALAAERRIAANSSTKVVLSRCFLCAEDITGKVPFEYNANRFCSMPCLKAHRTSLKQLL